MASILNVFLLFYIGLLNQPSSPTEEDKIRSLITFIEQQKGVFIRNGSAYSPKDAAAHLKMKREKAGNKIKTAKQFILKIASESSMTGTPYRFKYHNGKEVLVKDLLIQELNQIEKSTFK